MLGGCGAVWDGIGAKVDKKKPRQPRGEGRGLDSASFAD